MPPVSGVSGPTRVSSRRAPGGRSYFSRLDNSPSSSPSSVSVAAVSVPGSVGATEGTSGAGPFGTAGPFGAGVEDGAGVGAGDGDGAGGPKHSGSSESCAKIGRPSGGEREGRAG